MEAEEDRKRTDQSFFVPVEEIREKGYDLSIRKYKQNSYTAVDYPPMNEILSDVDDLYARLGDVISKLKEMS